ncbi:MULTISPECIES: hypothetical protein [Pseudomonas]|uniref:hypothetical protein n=1 Tax=Pseudomonas TaxID=286 RepID=UPI0002725080|nr:MULTISPECIES: hypothetical protein [Pseudomonas]AUG02122.1 hypothetical protein CXQ81_16415 [Pseudomonas sp. 09C 129]AZD02151.1 hypothetical protein C4K27_2957 [Pseudomonas chlororaphis subsp. chlororaphis]MBM0280213.1 hypothetical protein [Pseudomonas chlororaphis]MDO1505146.1 hypothetical protein [Pseudomonas chlororaphis]ORM45040.1 hypothetical protein B6D51_27335 [Pseudomonas chlororaphis subsp. chlororaphis]
MKRALISSIGLSLMLSGCGLGFLPGCYTRPDLTMQPETLPTAVVGQPFSVKLEVVGADTPLTGFYIHPDHPLPEGLELSYQKRTHYALITGKPLTPGTYTINAYTSSYGTQCTGQEAQRTYQLKVLEAAQP